MVTESDLQKLKVADLKKLCKEKGLTLLGTKSELISRLLEFEGAKEEDSILDESLISERNLLNHSESTSLNNNVNKSMGAVEIKSTNKADTTTPTKAPPTTRSDSTEKPKINKIEAPVSGDALAKDKLEQRIKRFGAVSEGTKKLVRAARFLSTDTPPTNTTNTTSPGSKSLVNDSSLLKKRAERFNLNKNATSTTADPDVIQKRKQRFGQVTTTKSTTVGKDDDEVILKRKAKFGGVTSGGGGGGGANADSKKQKRAERFGLKK